MTTVTMRSGAVTLRAGEAVGRHTTGSNEEALVVMSGRGELRIEGGASVALAGPCVAYCPPKTWHDVHNVGVEPLCYVYVVALAE